MTGTKQDAVVSGACTPAPNNSINLNRDVTGGPASLEFLFESSAAGPTPEMTGSVTVTETTKFTGALSGSVITGTLGFQQVGRGSNVVGNISSTIASNGQTTIQVTLTR